jgi:hypothetical protein
MSRSEAEERLRSLTPEQMLAFEAYQRSLNNP